MEVLFTHIETAPLLVLCALFIISILMTFFIGFVSLHTKKRVVKKYDAFLRVNYRVNGSAIPKLYKRIQNENIVAYNAALRKFPCKLFSLKKYEEYEV